MPATVKVYRRCQVAAKVEATEGTAETLTATEAKLKAMNIALTATADLVERDVCNASFGAVASALGPQSGRVEFDIDLCGSGVSAATAPEYAALLKMCGFSETVGASVTYALTNTMGTGSTDCRSGTIGFYVDGLRYLLVGARGTWEIRAETGKRLMIHFSLEGKWGAWGDVALLTISGLQTALPLVVRSATLTLNSVTLRYSSFSITGGIVTELRPDGNDSTGYFSNAYVDRVVTADLTMEAPATSEIDPLALCQAGTEVALNFQVGTAGGNRITIAATKAQVMSFPSPERDGGRLVYKVKLKLDQTAIGSGGEMTIVSD